MSKVIMVGCDLHDRTLVIRFAEGRKKPQQASFANDARGREKMIERLHNVAQQLRAERIVFAYEASAQGYGLADLLLENRIECHVLSPTHLPKTAKSAKNKTDSKDAQMLLEQVRGFVLAGNTLPTVWTPPQRVRDDREIVRARIDAADELTRVKTQVLSMLKRRGIEKPAWYHCKWGKRFAQWLRDLAKTLDSMVAPVLESLVDRYELFRAEILRLDGAVRQLAKTNRYRAAHNELRKIPGIGLLTAMSFLTEMGDLHRFDNRRQVAAYLGACPSSFESGEANDRKGRITRQGPSRLRKLLCQASWVAQRYCLETKQTYKRIRGGKSNRTKKAIVAVMRRLGIKMWHRALSCGVSSELIGRPTERHRRVANGSPPTPALLLAGRQQTI